MELRERDGALARLDGLLRESARAGRVALVTGEAGIGKSALVTVFTRRCRARVLTGFCDPLVTPRALGPLHDLGRQAGGRLAERLSAGADRAAVLDALVEELGRAPDRRPAVVVVEDAHWADEATTDLLVVLARRIERLAALLVVTYRDDEVGADHPLRAALAAMPAAVTRRIALPVLSEACVTALAGPGVYRLTGGNPLLVTECLAAGPGIPESVRDLVLARLRRLPPPARDLARLVAVVPTRMELRALRGRESETESCLDAGMLVADGDAVAYRHELLRRAVVDSLSPIAAVALHREALALLATMDGIDPARLTHHARAAGDTGAVLRHGTAAAVRAAAQGAHREAAAHYRAVAPHVGGLAPRDRAELLEAYAVQAYLAGVSSEGLAAGRTALGEWQRLGDPHRIGGCLRWVSRLAWWSGQGGPAREAAARAVEVLVAAPPGPELAMAVSNLSQLHMLAHELDEAARRGAEALALATRLGDTGTARHTRINLATARLLAGDLSAAGDLRALHTEAAAAGQADHAARALVNRASALLELNEYRLGAQALDEAFTFATAEDLDGYGQYLLGLRATIRLERLDWDGALADAKDALDRPARLGVAVVPALVARGRILSARGDDQALAVLDRAAGHAAGLGELQWIGPVAAARAEHFRHAGLPERAVEAAGPAWELAVARGHRWLAAELAFRSGQPDADWARERPYSRLAVLSPTDRPAVTGALATLDRLGATRAAHRLRADLRRHGVTGVPRGPRPATAANAAGLTTRQAEVLRLLADGLSNAGIAGRLALSPKTVEHHISAVLGKLGATSRGQAVATARRHGLVE